MPWLLEKSDPAVRAVTLRQLLDRGPRDAELRETQQRAMSSPPISTLLKRQRTDGGWPGPNMYGPKYQGSHWSNLLPIEYRADPRYTPVKRAAPLVLEELAEPSHGGHARGLPRGSGSRCVTV